MRLLSIVIFASRVISICNDALDFLFEMKIRRVKISAYIAPQFEMILLFVSRLFVSFVLQTEVLTGT